MTKKLTISEINNRLLPTGIQAVGEYVSSTKSTTLKCGNGHIWKTRVANLLNRGDGCPHCSGHSAVKRWTTFLINEHLSSRGIKLISNYSGKVKDKGTFMCDVGHQWETSVTSVLCGSGCKLCYGKNIPLTLDQIQDRYKDLGLSLIHI